MSSCLPTVLSNGRLAVATEGLSKRFGEDWALRGLNLQIPEAAIYVLVGPNGAGKSTAIKVLLDLVRADTGEANVFGLDPRANGPAVRAQVGYVPEHRDWGYGWMKVDTLLEHHSRFFPTWDPAYARALTRAFCLQVDRKLGELSKGQARRVQLTMALAHRPPLLILDEPTDGLDPVMRDEALGLLVDHLADNPTTVVISTHMVHEVDRMADHLGVMDGGRLLAQVSRDVLHAQLRRYRAATPRGWAGVPALKGTVVRRASMGREIQWMIWGTEDEIAAHLTLSGAVVQDIAPVPLEDAAMAVLSTGGQP